MYRQKPYSLQIRFLLMVIVLLFFSVTLSYLFAKFGFIVFAPVYGFVFFLLFLAYEIRMQASHKETSVFVPLIVLSLPFQAVFFRTIPVLLAAQISILLVILFYFQIYSSQDRYEYLRKIKLLLLPTIAFAVSIIISYLMSGDLQRKHWLFLLYLLGSICYAYLACIYCKDLLNIKKMLWIFIIIGVIQLPFLYAQSRGWTDSLPANLRMFTSSIWGGSESYVSVLRYGGMFHDYELLAEYLDMTALFCIPILMFTSSTKERFFAFLSLGFILTAGFYTGTRAFIPSLGIGLAVMIFLMIIKKGLDKNLLNILIVASILVFAVYFLSTQELFSGYINRFLNFDFRPGYYDTRTIVWNASFSLMEKLPFTGYGTSMKELFISAAGGNYDYPHSLYYWVLLTAGYPGFIAVLIMVFSPLLWMLRVLLNKSSINFHSWAIVLISVWIVWSVNEIKIEFTRYPFYMNIVFFLLGIMASFYNIVRRKSINDQE